MASKLAIGTSWMIPGCLDGRVELESVFQSLWDIVEYGNSRYCREIAGVGRRIGVRTAGGPAGDLRAQRRR
jgi:hypothetical protein